MSFDKIKKLWGSVNENKSDESIIQKTQNFFNSSIRRVSTTSLTIEQFQDYLTSMPNTYKKYNKKKLSTNSTLKPQLLKRCYKNVQEIYFDNSYQIDESFFQKSKKFNRERQFKMHQQLDQVQVCLFNQITSRFDEILSVLRTLESLECIATYNQEKLKQIRSGNMASMKKVTAKHAKIAMLLKKKQRLTKVLQKAQKIKIFTHFNKIQPNILNSNTSQFYESIANIKNNEELFKQIKSTSHFEQKIEAFEATLRKSFSDSLNDHIFKYICADLPYDGKFWKKFMYRNDIFEDRLESQGSVLLDESMILDDQTIIRPSRKEEEEKKIIYSLEKGWEDGEYSVDCLKIKIESALRSMHQKYLLEFRDFCNDVCQRTNKQVQNPSLPNLLKEMSISFCSKAFNHFFDIHKSLLLRVSSLYNKMMRFVYKESLNQNNIEKKQKLSVMAEGFNHVLCYTLKSVFDKTAEIIEIKKIYETTDITDFKNMISVMQGIQEFIQAKLVFFYEVICAQQSFLNEQAQTYQQKIPLSIVKKAKEDKLFLYISKMHKNAIEIQLKESLQNEIWQPTDIPTFYYDSLHYLISGESLNLRRNKSNLRSNGSMMFDTSVLMDSIQREQSFLADSKTLDNFRIIRNDIIIQQKTYKVTTTVLLIVEILQDYLTLAQNFPVLKAEIGKKINQILRSYNTSSCQLIIHAGAVALKKITSKIINSRHLALSSLCLSFLLYIVACISKRFQIFECQKIQEAIIEHISTIITKLNGILLYKIDKVKGEINLESIPTKGTQEIINNTQTLHNIMKDYYDKTVLAKIFTGDIIQIYLNSLSKIKVVTRVDAESLKDDMAFFFNQLKFLENLIPNYEVLRMKAEDVVRKAFESL